MQAKKLTVILNKLVCKTSILFELPSSVHKEHLLRLFISDVSDDKVLDDLSRRNPKLLCLGKVESSHVYSDFLADVFSIDQVDHSFILELNFLIVVRKADLGSIVKEDLVFSRDSKSRADDP